LGVKEGDKILFIEEAGKVYILNASMEALKKAQAAFAEEAERVGLKDEDDIVAMIKQASTRKNGKVICISKMLDHLSKIYRCHALLLKCALAVPLSQGVPVLQYPR